MVAIRVGTSSSGAPVLLNIDGMPRVLADPMQVRTGKTMGPIVESTLAGRRTVRITYRRVADEFSVDVRQGDEVIDRITTVRTCKYFDTETAEAIAEREAASAARCRGLGISRVDVP